MYSTTLMNIAVNCAKLFELSRTIDLVAFIIIADIATDLLRESSYDCWFLWDLLIQFLSADHFYSSSLANQNRFSSKVFFRHQSMSLNCNGNYRYYSHIRDSYRTFVHRYRVGIFLAAGESLHSSHLDVFFGVSFCLCRARVTFTRGSKSQQSVVYG